MNGYIKHSKLGLIPNDWKGSKLSEIVDLIHGYQFRSEDFTSDGIAVIKIGNVMGNDLKLDNLSFIDYSRLENFKQYKIEKGDILMSLTGNIGRVIEVGTLESEYLQNYRVGKFIPVNSNELIKRYIKYLLSSPLVLSQFFKFSNQSAQANFGKQDMDKVWVTIPTSLPEQQKIAEILSTVDAKIEVIDQQIKETQALKKGLMQRLLTKGIGHTEFKDSPLGEIPKSWEVKELGEISEVKGRIGYRGYTKADLVEKGQGALALGGAQIDNQNKLKLTQPVYLTWEKYEESPEIKITEGDIIFAQRGTLGRTALINTLTEPATINPSMVLIKNIKCSNKLLYYYLCSSHVQDAVAQISTATAVPMISQKQIKEFKIGIPPINEQTKIADILSSVDDKLEVLLEKKTHYQELKQGLMQQLLTGKIRVSVNN